MNTRKVVLFLLSIVGAAAVFCFGVGIGRGEIGIVRIQNKTEQEITSGKLFFDQGMLLFDGIKPGKTRSVRLHLDQDTQSKIVVYLKNGIVLESHDSKLQPGRRLRHTVTPSEIQSGD